ncbi:MAG: helix-turn-helix transcriptional regulator [Bacteroidia bacterium]|nr:helix-turn-helix transcriptional regulator [Bacteroidia bacterium]
MPAFHHSRSIAEVHHLLGLPSPLHPLITVLRGWPAVEASLAGVRMTSELYIIGLKGGVRGSLQYGRNAYDFEEGTLIFTAPHQALTIGTQEETAHTTGWTLLFHPDLIRRSELGRTIRDFAFFDYSVHEALHVSEKERIILAGFVQYIETELAQNADKHSQELIIANLHALLKYCRRYYDRQFFSRTNLSRDHIVQFEQYLETYFASDSLAQSGPPTVAQCGEALNMSARYLSDMLKIETGKSAKDHIHDHIIEKAKTLLLGSNASVSEVAYGLGFEYPQHFSKLFKAKTGLNPTAYRALA